MKQKKHTTILYSKKNKFIIFFSFIIFILLLSFAFLRNEAKSIMLDDYETLLKHHDIKKAKISGNEVFLYTKDREFVILKDVINLKELSKQTYLENKPDYSFYYEYIMIAIIFAIFLVYLNILKKQSNEDLKKIRKESKNYDLQQNFISKTIKPTTSNVSFADVAGIQNVKEELSEIVDFLKDPHKYTQYGIKLPKGVLLMGPPGVGKTLVAKAVAGEAKVPFFYQSGSSFAEIYVGMGAKRVRELFSQAKYVAPSIIFIDEIDSVAKARNGFRNDEREATLNQLLTEIDGFEDSSGVIVIAATNKIDLIDEALLRSGRFDRRIFISMPNLEERKEILKIYLASKPHAIDIEEIAKMSVGFSGAALATFVNEAAINALRRKSKIINLQDFYDVREKVIIGHKKAFSLDEKDKKIQADYQAAKALSAYWFEVDFDKFTLLNHYIKENEKDIESKTAMIAKIKVYLSGIAISQINHNESYTNSKEDLSKARFIAKIMSEHYAMGKSIAYNPQDTEDILENAFHEVKTFLSGMKNVIEKISNLIETKESINKKDLQKILNENF